MMVMIIGILSVRSDIYKLHRRLSPKGIDTALLHYGTNSTSNYPMSLKGVSRLYVRRRRTAYAKMPQKNVALPESILAAMIPDTPIDLC